MQKANGILITRNDDYGYIDRFIGFLERIIDIIIKLFDKIQGVDVGKFFNEATKTDAATPTN